MNKTAIKNYAIWARVQLIESAKQRAFEYEITENGENKANVDSIGGRLLSVDEKEQRKQLIAQIQRKGYSQVMEEAAYTWFNRFIALRFMEVNGYLPSKTRVFTDENGAFKPEILKEAMSVELDGLDRNKVLNLLDKQDNEELYKYLIITQCNALSEALPIMFEKISNWTELLFPANLLRQDSILGKMISMIPEDDWKDAVQIIGWLYESYNIEQNELVYDGTLSKEKIPKELVSAATTIFTPDWPVRYMVENSLGRLWVEGHPNDELKANWKYYLEEAEQEPEVQAQLAEIRKEYAALKPEEIKVIDPCMGSGHILVYMFDVLVQIYESYGYNAREAAGLILQNNLYGLDIDDRAAQLAYFAVMMKARQYDRRIFSRGIQPHVYAIIESSGISSDILTYFENGNDDLKKAMETIVFELHDAKEYGSILNVTQVDFAALYARLNEIKEDISLFATAALSELCPIIEIAQVLAQKYNVIVTNPPYLGSSRFSPKLDKYVKDNYSDEKPDLSMVMFKRAIVGFAAKNGFISFITTSSWMFLSSFEKLRNTVQRNATINSLVDFGTELFEGKVGHNPIVSWVCRRCQLKYNMTAIRLVDYCYSRREEKEIEFFDRRNHYTAKYSNFSKIPGSPVAYWVSEKIFDIFRNSPNLDQYATPRQGLITGDNNKFLRFWFEVLKDKVAFGREPKKKWYPINKGGDFRRWYGNQEYIVNWENDGNEILSFKDEKGNLRSRPQNLTFNFKPSVSWSLVTSGGFSARFYPDSFMFNVAGICCFPVQHFEYILALMNTKIITNVAQILNPTINMNAGDIAKVPIMIDTNKELEVKELVIEQIDLSKQDWNSFENSWNFKKHPLV